MAKRKGVAKGIGLDFHDMEQMLKRYEKIGASIKPATEKALQKSHSYVTKQLHQHMQNPFLPAGGKYSTGDTEKSIVESDRVFWLGGSQAYIPVGFDLSKTHSSIFLMYGTPKMEPNKHIYEDVWGRKTRTHIREIQEETLWDELEKLKGG